MDGLEISGLVANNQKKSSEFSFVTQPTTHTPWGMPCVFNLNLSKTLNRLNFILAVRAIFLIFYLSGSCVASPEFGVYLCRV